jgi:hypothetical protein
MLLHEIDPARVARLLLPLSCKFVRRFPRCGLVPLQQRWGTRAGVGPPTGSSLQLPAPPPQDRSLRTPERELQAQRCGSR